jgi:hypothetical protein
MVCGSVVYLLVSVEVGCNLLVPQELAEIRGEIGRESSTESREVLKLSSFIKIIFDVGIAMPKNLLRGLSSDI